MRRAGKDRMPLGELHGDRRSAGRRRQQMLLSSLGPVLDLSIGGARVATHRVPRESPFQVLLLTEEGPLPVDAVVAWSRRTGLFRLEVGLQFVDVDLATARGLTRISSQYQYTDVDFA